MNIDPNSFNVEEKRKLLWLGQLTAGFSQGQRSGTGSSGGVQRNLKQQEDTHTHTHL